MRSIRLLGVALAAAALSCMAACAPMSTAPPGSAGSSPAPVTTAVVAVADTAAAVADAMNVAPPTTLSSTTIDEKAIHFAFQEFARALTLIDTAIAAKIIVPGSTKALAVQSGIRMVQRSLNAASAAQRAGNATSYGEALRQSKNALAALQISLGQ